MIISKTPYRISFFGGGTDYSGWFKKNEGEVLSTTIDKYLYLTCRHLPPFFEHKYRNVWSIIEKVKTIEELKHSVVKNLFLHMNVKKGLELHYDGDLPAQSGMGSSSAYVVGLINILYSFKKIYLNKKLLADASLFFEHKILKERVGYQDQIAAAYGGFNSIKFFKNGEYKVKKFSLKKKIISNLNKNLLLVYSGNERRASDIVGKYIDKLNFEKKKEMKSIHDFVYKAKLFLRNEKLDDFGHLIGESWIKKKELSNSISTEKIDHIYNLGMKNGALGGKVLGAGGGGMMIFYVKEKDQEKFKLALKNFLVITFQFEDTGSSIILNTNKENIYE
jgi:D-glycero-alpha-D-manno-heptose-7-phosphate kinase